MKICVICKEQILTDSEKWVRTTDFEGEEQTGEVYCHLECWRERFQITNSERKKKKMYKDAITAINNIKDKFGNGGLLVNQ